MARVAAALGLALFLLGCARAVAEPMHPPPAPRVLALDADGPDAARLSWEDLPGAVFRLCVTYDRARRQPYACFAAGSGTETAVGVPTGDGEQYLLSLQACRTGQEDCSDPVDAGVVGRRSGGGFDFYATALLQPDGRARLSGYSRRPGATIAYHQAAPGRADQRRGGCAGLGEGRCGAEVLALPGALAGATQEMPGLGSAGLTFQIRERPRAVLMFDDGTGLFTGGRLTAQVILDEFGVKGTFFLVGRVMRDHPGAVRALIAAGHRVGNHTFSHRSLTGLADAQIAQELDLTEQQYRAIHPGGTTKPCFRAPNGAIDGRVTRAVEARGYRQFHWTVTSLDWTWASADQIVRNVVSKLHDGALISFHTQMPATLAALRTLLPLMQSWGYVFALAC